MLFFIEKLFFVRVYFPELTRANMVYCPLITSFFATFPIGVWMMTM